MHFVTVVSNPLKNCFRTAGFSDKGPETVSILKTLFTVVIFETLYKLKFRRESTEFERGFIHFLVDF